MRWFNLKGTTAVVVGASGLLGAKIIEALKDCGANTFGIDLKPTGSEPIFSMDISKEEEYARLFDELKKLENRTHTWVFVNCSYPRTTNWPKLAFENVPLKDWNENVSLHLGSAFLFSQRAVSFIKQSKKNGRLINFGSIYGESGPDLRIYEGTSMTMPSPYSAIKAGISGITRFIATTEGGNGILANTVCPGGVQDRQPESFIKNYCSRTPVGRMATAEDIAGVIAFLAGPSASYITGQTLMVDGGWTAW